MSTTTTEVDVLQPFGKEPDRVITDDERGAGYDPSLYEPPAEDLGAIAAQGLDDDAGPEQPTLDGTEPGGKLVRFIGASFKSGEDIDYPLGSEMDFTVRGTVMRVAEEIMADKHHRDVVTVRVSAVAPVGSSPA